MLYKDETMNKTLVIYHGDCIDGFTAAWVASKKFDSPIFKPAKYGEDAPMQLIDDKTDVYILDFSYARDVLIDIESRSSSTLVLDHHKTAEENLHGLDFCEFDMNRSGAGMTWDRLTRKPRERPWLVNYVQDRDLWRFELPDSKAINAYIGATEQTFNSWGALAKEKVRNVKQGGYAILKYIEQYVYEIIGSLTRWVEFERHKVPVVNAPFKGISEVLGFLASEAVFAMGWWQESSGQFQYSLRSRGDFDVSEIARKYGGGGHKNAAGFYRDELIV